MDLYNEAKKYFKYFINKRGLQAKMRFALGNDRPNSLSYIYEDERYEALSDAALDNFIKVVEKEGKLLTEKEINRLKTNTLPYTEGIGLLIDKKSDYLSRCSRIEVLLRNERKQMSSAYNKDLIFSMKKNSSNSVHVGVNDEFRSFLIKSSIGASEAFMLANQLITSNSRVVGFRIQQKYDKNQNSYNTLKSSAIYDLDTKVSDEQSFEKLIVKDSDIISATTTRIVGNTRAVNGLVPDPAGAGASELSGHYDVLKLQDKHVIAALGYPIVAFDIVSNDRVINPQDVARVIDSFDPGTGDLYRNVLDNSVIGIPYPKVFEKHLEPDELDGLGVAFIRGSSSNPSGLIRATVHANNIINGAKADESFINTYKTYAPKGLDDQHWYYICRHFVKMAGDDGLILVPIDKHPEGFSVDTKLIGHKLILDDKGILITIGKEITRAASKLEKLESRAFDNPNFPLVFPSLRGSISAYYYGLRNVLPPKVFLAWQELFPNPDGLLNFFFENFSDEDALLVRNEHIDPTQQERQEHNTAIYKLASEMNTRVWDLKSTDLMKLDPDVLKAMYHTGKANEVITSNLYNSLPKEGEYFFTDTFCVSQIRYSEREYLNNFNDVIMSGVPHSFHFYTMKSGDNLQFGLLHSQLPIWMISNPSMVRKKTFTAQSSELIKTVLTRHNEMVDMISSITADDVAKPMSFLWLWYFIHSRKFILSESCRGTRLQRFLDCSLCKEDLPWIDLGYPAMGKLDDSSYFLEIGKEYDVGDPTVKILKIHKTSILTRTVRDLSADEELANFSKLWTSSFNGEKPADYGDVEAIYNLVRSSLNMPNTTSTRTAVSPGDMKRAGTSSCSEDIAIDKSLLDVVSHHFPSLTRFVKDSSPTFPFTNGVYVPNCTKDAPLATVLSSLAELYKDSLTEVFNTSLDRAVVIYGGSGVDTSSIGAAIERRGLHDVSDLSMSEFSDISNFIIAGNYTRHNFAKAKFMHVLVVSTNSSNDPTGEHFDSVIIYKELGSTVRQLIALLS